MNGAEEQRLAEGGDVVCPRKLRHARVFLL
jgi:hypothetical protein